MNYYSKIVNQKQIEKIVEGERKKGKSIVTHNGSFDIIHSGHIQSISYAKSKGDILVILLNSDLSIKLYKGSSRPFVKEKDRAIALSALADTDYIVLFDEINPKRILNLIKPNIHCVGKIWGANCIERETVEKNKGKILVLPFKEGYSTTKVIESIFKRASNNACAIFLDRDGIINFNKNGYIHHIEDFEFKSDAMKALQKASQTKYRLIIVTNQSGIGKGYYRTKDFQNLTRWMVQELKKIKIRIDHVYFCPHTDFNNCNCRKPKIGMFLSAVNDFGLNLSKSWFVGDDERDIIAGREANIQTIKIGKSMNKKLKLEPRLYARNMLEAINYIIKNS